MRRLKFIDLFACLGGFHLALEELGHECVFASESDDELRSLYVQNFPEAKAFAVGDIPLLVGELPTATQPLRKVTRAVVSPIPPGQLPGKYEDEMVANRLTFPAGETWTIVVPVP